MALFLLHFVSDAGGHSRSESGLEQRTFPSKPEFSDCCWAYHPWSFCGSRLVFFWFWHWFGHELLFDRRSPVTRQDSCKWPCSISPERSVCTVKLTSSSNLAWSRQIKERESVPAPYGCKHYCHPAPPPHNTGTPFAPAECLSFTVWNKQPSLLRSDFCLFSAFCLFTLPQKSDLDMSLIQAFLEIPVN